MFKLIDTTHTMKTITRAQAFAAHKAAAEFLKAQPDHTGPAKGLVLCPAMHDGRLGAEIEGEAWAFDGRRKLKARGMRIIPLNPATAAARDQLNRNFWSLTAERWQRAPRRLFVIP